MKSKNLKKQHFIQNKWIIIYLKLWKLYLYIRKFFIYLGIKWKKIKTFYVLKLYLAYPFSWRKRISLLEYRKHYWDVIRICYKKLNRIKNENSDYVAELYEIIGRNQRNLNLINEALFCFQIAQKLNSRSPSLYYEMGLIYFIKRNYPLARRSMEFAIKNGYDTVALRIHLGKIYYQMGMLNQAEDCFKRVLNFYPREGSLYFLLGIVYKSKVEYQLAIDAFKKAIAYGSDQKEEHLGLAEIYTRLGYWREAIQEYRYILEFEPDSFVAHYFLGYIYEIQGLEDKAIKEYILANKINPNDEDTKRKLTQLLASPINHEKCI